MERNFTNITDPKGKPAKLFAGFLALVIWQMAAVLIGNRLLLVGPVQVAVRLAELIPEKDFWRVTGFTFFRITAGFLAGLLAAVFLAALAARFPLAETLLRPYMAAVQTVPVASFIVIALLWLSSKRLSSFISFLIVLPVLYANILQGIHAADRKLLEMAAVFRMSGIRRLRCIYAPAVRPFIQSACHVALGLCWKAGVAAELIAVSSGSIGGRMYDAKVYLEIADLFAWTVTIVAVSACFEKLFDFAAEKLFRVLEGR